MESDNIKCNDGRVGTYDFVEITNRDLELIGDALDFYVSSQGVFVSYDEHIALAKEVNKIKNKYGIL